MSIGSVSSYGDIQQGSWQVKPRVSEQEETEKKVVPAKEEKTDKKEADKKKSEGEKTSGELWRRGKSKQEQHEIEQQIKEYKQIDARVKTHEQAHKSVGGQYAGSINYEKTTAPDGKQYVVGGDVSIDVSAESTPRKTITKMQIVQRAALAPADPSGQDRSVASSANAREAQARSQLAKELQDKSKPKKVFKDDKAREQEVGVGEKLHLSPR